MAHDFGAAALPSAVKNAMALTSKIMTTLVYRG
jgi:demethoxyubiquinone hydroxylase (CLK1/Coq7/Cat5 family)